jgi:hypothetical protein
MPGCSSTIADAVAADAPDVVRDLADESAPVFRRRQVAMDDMVAILEGLRSACPTVLSPVEMATADRAIDAGIEQFLVFRKLAGDARKRNPILAAIYKGG